MNELLDSDHIVLCC